MSIFKVPAVNPQASSEVFGVTVDGGEGFPWIPRVAVHSRSIGRGPFRRPEGRARGRRRICRHLVSARRSRWVWQWSHRLKFRNFSIVKVVGKEPFFKQRVELSKARGDLFLGELGRNGRGITWR